MARKRSLLFPVLGIQNYMNLACSHLWGGQYGSVSKFWSWNCLLYWEKCGSEYLSVDQWSSASSLAFSSVQPSYSVTFTSPAAQMTVVECTWSNWLVYMFTNSILQCCPYIGSLPTVSHSLHAFLHVKDVGYRARYIRIGIGWVKCWECTEYRSRFRNLHITFSIALKMVSQRELVHWYYKIDSSPLLHTSSELR